MIDYLAIGVTHLLLLVALLRLLGRQDLDREEPPVTGRVAPLSPAPDAPHPLGSSAPGSSAPLPPRTGGVARLPRPGERRAGRNPPRGGGRA